MKKSLIAICFALLGALPIVASAQSVTTVYPVATGIGADTKAVALGNALSNTYIYTANYTVTGSPTATYMYAATGTCAYEAKHAR